MGLLYVNQKSWNGKISQNLMLEMFTFLRPNLIETGHMGAIAKSSSSDISQKYYAPRLHSGISTPLSGPISPQSPLSPLIIPPQPDEIMIQRRSSFSRESGSVKSERSREFTPPPHSPVHAGDHLSSNATPTPSSGSSSVLSIED
jgi:hypothetical protein